MTKKKNKKPELLSVNVTISQNRRARFDYEITQTFEAGIALTGTEVKSLRLGRANIAESYATEEAGEIVLINARIEPFEKAGKHLQHDPKRKRKLLLHRREINKIIGALHKDGMTLTPISLYFNAQGRAKIELGLAKGKKLVDKRETIKQRDWNRQKSRVLKGEQS